LIKYWEVGGFFDSFWCLLAVGVMHSKIGEIVKNDGKGDPKI